MTRSKTREEREKELQTLMSTPQGRAELETLASRYQSDGGSARPERKSVITRARGRRANGQQDGLPMPPTARGRRLSCRGAFPDDRGVPSPPLPPLPVVRRLACHDDR